jgi:predicted patatin/cPLA2 family phospholipase
VDVLTGRSQIYNDTLDKIEQLEQEGKAIVIRPSATTIVSRVEKNTSMLQPQYY